MGDSSANTNIATTTFNSDLSPWIIWNTPTLSNDTTFFGFAHLIHPSNSQQGLDTSITFRWRQTEDAEKYIIQLSSDLDFLNIVLSASTTDTLKTISGLTGGKRYYWRVQVKNIVGAAGLWSDINNSPRMLICQVKRN